MLSEVVPDQIVLDRRKKKLNYNKFKAVFKLSAEIRLFAYPDLIFFQSDSNHI